MESGPSFAGGTKLRATVTGVCTWLQYTDYCTGVLSHWDTVLNFWVHAEKAAGQVDDKEHNEDEACDPESNPVNGLLCNIKKYLIRVDAGCKGGIL